MFTVYGIYYESSHCFSESVDITSLEGSFQVRLYGIITYFSHFKISNAETH